MRFGLARARLQNDSKYSYVAGTLEQGFVCDGSEIKSLVDELEIDHRMKNLKNVPTQPNHQVWNHTTDQIQIFMLICRFGCVEKPRQVTRLVLYLWDGSQTYLRSREYGALYLVRVLWRKYII